MRANKQERLGFAFNVLLSIALALSFATGSLAQQPEGDENEGTIIYLPLTMERINFIERSGILDPEFDADGRVTTNILSSSDLGAATALQEDGKILLVGSSTGSPDGDFALARFNQDGSLDATFGNNGRVTTNFGDGASGSAVAVQADGKIVVAGTAFNDYTAYDFAVARYNPSGSLDTSFSSDGMVTADFGGTNYGRAVALQPDGKIVIIGVSGSDIAIARFNSDGVQDTTFGTNGLATFWLGIQSNWYDAVLQSDGKILAAGFADNSITTGPDFALVCINSNGSLDTTFDSDGLVTTDFGMTDDRGYSIELQENGKIIVVGYTYDSVDYNIALVRYNLDGSLDNTFSGDGQQITDVYDREYARAVALQSDGKIIVAGYVLNGATNDFAMLRYSSNGSLDTTFGIDGWVLTDFQGGADVGRSLALAADDKIILAGHAYSDGSYDFALARYSPDGSLDTAFDTDGRATAGFGSDDIGYAVAQQSDGKFVVVGQVYNGSDKDFALTRYLPNGELDTGFGSNGYVMLHFGYANDYGYAIAIQPDGKLLITGSAFNPFTDNEIALARYNPDGSLDTSFDGDGWLTTDFAGGYDYGYAIALQADEKIIVAGYANNGSNYDFALARYNPDGSLDSTFDTDGRVTTDFGFGSDYGKSIILQPDGKIVVAGYAHNGSNYDFALARYNPDGSLDTSFSGDGRVAYPLGVADDYGNSAVLQADGKIVLAGYTYNGVSYDFAVARYNPDGSLDTSFSGGWVDTDISTYSDYAYSVLLQPNGKIIVAGSGYIPMTRRDFALARYNSDGTLDTTFDGDGRLTIDFDGGYDYGYAAVLQQDGMIVVAGYTDNNVDYDFALVRLK